MKKLMFVRRKKRIVQMFGMKLIAMFVKIQLFTVFVERMSVM